VEVPVALERYGLCGEVFRQAVAGEDLRGGE
jgi:hypothetical protein